MLRKLSSRRRRPPRLVDFYQDFADRQLWKPSTRRSMDHSVTTAPVAGSRLDEINRCDVEEWVLDLVRGGLAPSTIRTRVGAVRTVLNRAVEDGVIEQNPCDRVRLPRVTPRGRLPLPLSMADVDRMIATSRQPLALAIDLAARAGLRMGEIRGLQPRDIDPIAGSITVRRQIHSPAGGGWEVQPPKYDGQRTVPLDPTLEAHLSTYLTGRELEERDWLIPGHRGAPIQLTTLARWWTRAKEECGVDEATRFHDLRHLYASHEIAAGRDVVRVQHALGHRDATTTLSVYSHAFSNRPPRAQEAS